MNRMSQSLILVLLGGAVLRVTVLSTTYVNYVKPGFRPFLIAAGAVVLVLGVVGLVQEWRKPHVTETGPAQGDEDTESGSTHAAAGDHGHHHGHDHSRVSRVAWLLCLPVFAIFLIAPPPLGAFAARSEEAPPPPPALPADAYVPLAADRATSMELGEFIGRAWGDSRHSLAGKKVTLTGFVVRSSKKDRWYVTRMQMSCCAADAIALKVAVLDAERPPDDTWVEVTGTWVAPKTDKIPNGTVAPELAATEVAEIPQPFEPYE
ncbi:TIGR03943 family protein [Planotetraspora mira]|uniref:TIGR03943 family protein n=2 Tax=Planotetraspora mira TaxID=58121 RepID=A0A8J3TJS3_9ACTN|nr:TIGR03943 family protein [Planotetraspora mira]